MTLDHDNTPHAIFNTISDTCWKRSEVIDFDLKNRNSDLPAYFSVKSVIFPSLSKFYYRKLRNWGFANICKLLIYVLMKVT